ncbi:hypothetical protein GCM10009551_089880 [Nocardiopsis tropica]|uniref:hypothetical protein n=1 Tax=Tsukamurella TaxID=2060 RepID=UPI001C7C9FD2|nr:hypothetical protein [Tsukamurella sp. TY48]GIZ96535.1 hypothetical protein TTY48_11470 [Tsukamurella sp. TY48]
MYEDIASSRVDDLGKLLDEPVDFRISEQFPGWLTAAVDSGSRIYVRWGSSFPAEDHWSLWLGDEWFDFNEVPQNWSISMGDSIYPWGGVPLGFRFPDKEEATEILLKGDG